MQVIVPFVLERVSPHELGVVYGVVILAFPCSPFYVVCAVER